MKGSNYSAMDKYSWRFKNKMIEDKEKRSEKYNIQWKIANTVKIGKINFFDLLDYFKRNKIQMIWKKWHEIKIGLNRFVNLELRNSIFINFLLIFMEKA